MLQWSDETIQIQRDEKDHVHTVMPDKTCCKYLLA